MDTTHHIKTVSVEFKVPEPEDIGVLNRFIKENLKSLEEINAVGVTGTVEVKFKIENDGQLTNFEVVKSLSPETDAEALRVAQLLPKKAPWPKQEGNSVITARSSIIYINFPYKPFLNQT